MHALRLLEDLPRTLCAVKQFNANLVGSKIPWQLTVSIHQVRTATEAEECADGNGIICLIISETCMHICEYKTILAPH